MTTTENPTPTAKAVRIRDRLLESLEWTRHELTKLAQIGRLKYDTTSLQRERAALHQELGKKSCELVKENRLTPEELKPIIERIDVLTARIEERRTAIDALIRSRNDPKPTSN